MPNDEEISKALDSKTDGETSPENLPVAGNNGLNGRQDDPSTPASTPEDGTTMGPSETVPPTAGQDPPSHSPKTPADKEAESAELPEEPEIEEQPPPASAKGPSSTEDPEPLVAEKDSNEPPETSHDQNLEKQETAEEEVQEEVKVPAEDITEASEGEDQTALEVAEAKTSDNVSDEVASKTAAEPEPEVAETQESEVPVTENVKQLDTGDKPIKPAKAPLPWEGVDFATLDKAGLVHMMELMAREENPITAEKSSRQLKPFFNKIQKSQRKDALEQFIAEGNDADGFAYRFDELDNRFDASYKLLRDRKVQKIKDLEREKEKNLDVKTQLLEELRALVDDEETNASINVLKKIQERWRALGPVPPQHAKSMWANYHALLDLYYDQRSIYFELKELDRKKNLEAKLELCEKAEKLGDEENLREAINELNELHEEFKHIGPVPKSDQEALWQRFKGASDKIYARRKEFVKHLKEDLKINLSKKSELAEEVQEFAAFTSDRIADWNKKTHALLELQKKWDAIGGLPRENAKEINRKFWGAFKGFFHHKGQFFKQLEGERGGNLEKKQVLVAEAQTLKDNTDWNETANKLKNLQKQWREIGPVPEKNRNEVYAQFKEACDHFFNKRRAQSQEIEKEYVVNLKKKQDICVQIEKMTSSKDFDLDKFLDLKESFAEIGYVPAPEVKNIREQFKQTVEEYLRAVPEDLQDEARQIKYDIEFEKLKSGPHADRKKGQKEQSLRREIGARENDISTWKNNLEFFAASKTADKLRAEFTGKINAATEEVRELKRQLRALRQI